LQVNEFAGVILPQENSNPLENAVRTGDNLLRSFEYETQGVYLSILVLMCFIGVFHVLCVLSFYLRNEVSRRGKLNTRKGMYIFQIYINGIHTHINISTHLCPHTCIYTYTFISTCAVYAHAYLVYFYTHIPTSYEATRVLAPNVGTLDDAVPTFEIQC
jgi:hypothetical protein